MIEPTVSIERIERSLTFWRRRLERERDTPQRRARRLRRLWADERERRIKDRAKKAATYGKNHRHA